MILLIKTNLKKKNNEEHFAILSPKIKLKNTISQIEKKLKRIAFEKATYNNIIFNI